MYKIRKITFIDHPILKNLSLDFCDMEGNVVDTVIFAGENGTGKSTVLNELYKISTYAVDFQCEIELESNSNIVKLMYYFNTDLPGYKMVYAKDHKGLVDIAISSNVTKKYVFTAIFSDVDINFHSNKVSSVTSLSLDSEQNSRRSSNDLPTKIKQLLIDIQSLDDADLARNARLYPEKKISELEVNQRMPRFTNAFNQMFDNLKYSRIENQNGQKSIIFKKNGFDIPIDNLSSGEKQIVYRGCFLLKDINAMKGAFVFIDEPEISLHPNWQRKIMDYYKGIYTSEEGVPPSQIFAVTHAPFVMHNDNLRND